MDHRICQLNISMRYFLFYYFILLSNFNNNLKLTIYWDLNMKLKSDGFAPLKLYGMTKDPETKEIIMIVEFADKGNLRNILSTNFNNILWKDKIGYLFFLTADLKTLHSLEYCHKDMHSGNILQSNAMYLSDFGLSRPVDEQKSDDKIYGVLPYIAPEVLNGEPYTKASDIYSFGILMTEISSGNTPFYDKKHDLSLSLAICNGLRPEFGKGTPEFYKKLAYRCMNANPKQRPTASELYVIFSFWLDSNGGNYRNDKKYGYYGREIKEGFKKADKEISNILMSYKKNPDAIYTSRAFKFINLPKPTNSSLNLEKDENNNEGILLLN